MADLTVLLPALRDLPRLHRIFHDNELIACHWHTPDSENLGRYGRAGILDVATTLVQQGSYPARVHAADKVVANVKRSVVDKNRRYRALSGIELCFDHCAGGASVWIRFQIENLRLQQNLVEQSVDVGSFLRRHFGRQNGTAKLLEHDTVLKEILTVVAGTYVAWMFFACEMASTVCGIT